MKVPHKFLLAILTISLFSLFTACSIEITQTQNVPTRPPATPTDIPTETPTPTEIPPTLTATATQPGDPTLTSTPSPTPTLSPTPTIPFAFQAIPSPELDIEPLKAPDSLTTSGITGRLVFLYDLTNRQAVVTYDLATGEISTLFVGPENTWLLAQSVHPDAEQILLSYAPPPPAGKPQYGYTDLFILSPDNPELQPVLQRTADFEAFFGAIFSPAGDYVYYTHFYEDSTATSNFRYSISRVGYPEGTPEQVVPNAFWQRLSRDGEKLAYVTFDGRVFDELFVANADGSDPVRALNPDEYPTVDAPFFSFDHQILYFSAVVEAPTPLSWWETLLGVHVALAHDVPSDWFRTDLTTGEVTRITEMYDKGMYGTISPDGEYIAFISATGLYIMNPDGTQLTQILASEHLYGSLDWIP